MREQLLITTGYGGESDSTHCNMINEVILIVYFTRNGNERNFDKGMLKVINNSSKQKKKEKRSVAKMAKPTYKVTVG